jgi:hypothetical protein
MFQFCNDHCISELNRDIRPYDISHIHVFLFIYAKLLVFLKVSDSTNIVVIRLNCMWAS